MRTILMTLLLISLLSITYACSFFSDSNSDDDKAVIDSNLGETNQIITPDLNTHSQDNNINNTPVDNLSTDKLIENDNLTTTITGTVTSTQVVADIKPNNNNKTVIVTEIVIKSDNNTKPNTGNISNINSNTVADSDTKKPVTTNDRSKIYPIIPITLNNLNSLKGNYKVDNYTINILLTKVPMVGTISAISTPDDYFTIQDFIGDGSIDIVNNDNINMKILINNDSTMAALARKEKERLGEDLGVFVPDISKFYINKTGKPILSADKKTLANTADNIMKYEIVAINDYSIIIKYIKKSMKLTSPVGNAMLNENGIIFLTKTDNNKLKQPKDILLFNKPILTANKRTSIQGRYYIEKFILVKDRCKPDSTVVNKCYSLKAGVQPDNSLLPSAKQKDLVGVLSIDIDNKKNTATLKIAIQTAKKYIAGWPLKRRVTGLYNDSEKPTTYTYQNIKVPITPTDNAKTILQKLGGVIINNETVRFVFNTNSTDDINHTFKIGNNEQVILDAVIMNDGGFMNKGAVREVPNKMFFK